MHTGVFSYMHIWSASWVKGIQFRGGVAGGTVPKIVPLLYPEKV